MVSKRFLILLPILLLLSLSLIVPSVSAAWWNTSWGYASNFTLNSGVTSNLSNFPGFIKINTTILILTNRMKSDCTDIRIIQNSNTILDTEIENCNSSTTTVWFRIPSFATGNNILDIYYGNPNALNIQNPMDIWQTAGYSAVWHAGNLSDVFTKNDFTATGSVTSVENTYCKFGQCWKFNSTNAILTKTSYTGISLGSVNSTQSLWLYLDKDDGSRVDLFAIGLKGDYKPRILFSHAYSASGGPVADIYHPTTASAAVVPGTFNMSSQVHMYTAGFYGSVGRACLNANCTDGGFTGSTATVADYIRIGNIEAYADFLVTATPGSTAYIDEARISNVSRSLDWTKAEYLMTSILGIEITNTVPANLTSVQISPVIAYDTSNLDCYANATGSNATIWYNYTWVNGSTSYSSGTSSGANKTEALVSTLSNTLTNPNEYWTCSVRATTDNATYSSTLNSTRYIEGVVFNSSTPANITFGNLFDRRLNDTYNFYDLSATNFQLWHTTNSSFSPYVYFINGTAYSGWINSSSYANTTSSVEYQLSESEIYPATYNMRQTQIQAIPHNVTTSVTGTNNFLSVEFLNFSTNTHYNVLEFMMNVTSGANGMTVYYCNSSYAFSNSPIGNGNCVNIGTQLSTTPYNHTHSQYSSHMIFIVPLNATSGLVNGVRATGKSYFVFRGTSGTTWTMYGVTNIIRKGVERLSTNSGLSWTNQTMTPDSHIHQFYNDSIYYEYSCFNETADSNFSVCSSTRADPIDVATLPPSSPIVYSPTAGIYGARININWTAAVSQTNTPIFSYNVTLRNSTGSVKYVVANTSASNLNASVCSKDIANGNYSAYVLVTDTNQDVNFGVSEPFTSRYGINVTAISPASGTFSSNPIVNITCGFGVLDTSTILNGITLNIVKSGVPFYSDTQPAIGNGTYTWEVNFGEGNFTWNCNISTTDCYDSQTTANRTLHVDGQAPSVVIDTPASDNFTIILTATNNYSQTLTYVATDVNRDRCWYNIDGGANISLNVSQSYYTQIANYSYAADDPTKWTNLNLGFDGNWNTETSLNSADSVWQYINIDSTKLNNTVGYVWRVKDSSITYDIILPNACWNRTTIELREGLIVQPGSENDYTSYDCFYSGSWTTLYSAGGLAGVSLYEQQLTATLTNGTTTPCGNTSISVVGYGIHNVSVSANDTFANIGTDSFIIGLGNFTTDSANIRTANLPFVVNYTYNFGGSTTSSCVANVNSALVTCTNVANSFQCAPIDSVDGMTSFSVTCTDTNNFIWISATTNIYIDTINPILVSTTFVNNSVYLSKKNLSGYFEFTDSNLWRFNVSIDGISIYERLDINSTTANFTVNYNTTSLSAGKHSMLVQAFDSHTAATIPEYGVSQALFSKELNYDTGKNTIKITAVDESVKLLNPLSTKKERDRYTFNYKPAKDQNNYTFEVETKDELHIINNEKTDYKTWIVSGNNWIDFYVRGRKDIAVTITQLAPNKARIVVYAIPKVNPGKGESTTAKIANGVGVIQFSSVGDLNVLALNYTFFVYNATLYYMPVVSETQMQSLAAVVNLGGENLATTAELFYNNTLSTNVSTSGNYSTSYVFNKSFFTPQVENTQQIVSYWRVNVSGYSEQIIFSQQVNDIGLTTNCSEPNATSAITFYGRDEETESLVTYSLGIDADIWISDPTLLINVHFDFANSTNYTLCVKPASAIYQIYAVMEYIAPDYADRKYYLYNTTISGAAPQDVNLYLLNLTTGGSTINNLFQIINQQTGNPIANSYIKFYRYYPGQNEYKLVEVEKTDANGRTISKLVLYDVFYRYSVDYPYGTTRLTTTTAKATQQTTILAIPLGTDLMSDFAIVADTYTKTTCDSTTATCAVSWDSLSGTNRQVRLEVYESTGVSEHLLSSETSTSLPGGALFYTITPFKNNTNYIAKAYIVTSNGDMVGETANMIDQQNVFSQNQPLRLASLLPLILLTISIICALLDLGTVGVVIGSMSGIIIGMVITIIPVNVGGVVSLAVLAFILIYKSVK
jgi:hypothetical protein